MANLIKVYYSENAEDVVPSDFFVAGDLIVEGDFRYTAVIDCTNMRRLFLVDFERKNQPCVQFVCGMLQVSCEREYT